MKTPLNKLQEIRIVKKLADILRIPYYQINTSQMGIKMIAELLELLNIQQNSISAQGDTGAAGPKGDKGDTGNIGPQGIQGPAGTNGADGTPGAKGDIGTQGPQGDTGNAGSQGVQGDPGSNGTDGTDGADGAPGPNQVTTATTSNINAPLKGDGSHVAAMSMTEAELSDAVSKKHSNSSDHDGGAQDTAIAAKTTLTAVKADTDVADAITKKHANTNDPASGEKSALAGTSGTPGSGNKYVTDEDARNSNARTPTTHSHAPSDVTGTAVVTADSRLSDARTPTAHNQGADTITSGSLDGDRLPALSISKKGGVPATGTPSGKYLKDDNTWATVSAGSTPTGTGWRHVTSGVEDGAASTPSASDVGAVAVNGAITGATKTKITYDAKGLVTAGADATTADIADSTDKRYCTDAQKTVIGNTSGTNSGNETGTTIKTALGITTLSGSNTGDQTLPVGGTPAVLLAVSGAAGSSPNFLRRDDTIAAFDSTAASVTTPLALGITGSVAFAARRDHQHQSPGGIATITGQVSINTTTTETTIITVTLPANLLLAGTQIRFKMKGTHQNQATSGILTIRMYVGATAGQTIVFPTQTSAVAASYMEMEGFATVRTNGSSGTYIANGAYWVCNAATTTISASQGGASTTSINTTSTAVVKLTAQWATSSATNALLIQQASIEISKM